MNHPTSNFRTDSFELITDDGDVKACSASRVTIKVLQLLDLRGEQGLSAENTWAWCQNLPVVIRELRTCGVAIEVRHDPSAPNGSQTKYILRSKVLLPERGS